MNIRVTDSYHKLRVEELELTADYLAKVAEEKERAKEERARLREEEIARREYEREQERLRKEQAHYEATPGRAARTRATSTAPQRMEAKLTEIQDALDGINRRAANIRAGHVYVISNVGAFGPDMVKIGMTRRLDPMDRVRELGDASVPVPLRRARDGLQRRRRRPGDPPAPRVRRPPRQPRQHPPRVLPRHPRRGPRRPPRRPGRHHRQLDRRARSPRIPTERNHPPPGRQSAASRGRSYSA